ncbi:hypothetical protein CDAR_18921 [Caerostris darwini]|uniref:Uncharacterized protein n=1 Tax=Caerostris darwini TaxID=1538125 RepID=A0AAV4WEB7_9ARAC|nr:hypothetical protein CDAR_18921 [Caerostris darwini]
MPQVGGAFYLGRTNMCATCMGMSNRVLCIGFRVQHNQDISVLGEALFMLEVQHAVQHANLQGFPRRRVDRDWASVALCHTPESNLLWTTPAHCFPGELMGNSCDTVQSVLCVRVARRTGDVFS